MPDPQRRTLMDKAMSLIKEDYRGCVALALCIACSLDVQVYVCVVICIIYVYTIYELLAA